MTGQAPCRNRWRVEGRLIVYPRLMGLKVIGSSLVVEVTKSPGSRRLD